MDLSPEPTRVTSLATPFDPIDLRRVEEDRRQLERDRESLAADREARREALRQLRDFMEFGRAD
jgi:hypothetical protein